MMAPESPGPHRILGPLGEGGMGEVYRAEDTRLNPEVAVKILPDVLAQDADRVPRFTREAQTLAEALPIARRITEALEAAHEQGAEAAKPLRRSMLNPQPSCGAPTAQQRTRR
jgi:hypothetical protein